MSNENKIAFIICTNNELYYNECVWYINNLYIPVGYEIDIIGITGAESMVEAYNVAMRDSDARYKVYLHQDVFIYHRQFIEDMLRIFRMDRKIGMIGMLGCTRLPSNAFVCSEWDVGNTYVCNIMKASTWTNDRDIRNGWDQVEAIDGMLMATQYDIDWREDLRLGWDFYDVSQSLEFIRSNYKIAVPRQEIPWCLHDCGFSKMSHYDEIRQIMLEEYKDFFSGGFQPQYDLAYVPAQEKIFNIIKGYVEKGRLEEALEIRNRIPEGAVGINDLQYALNILDIYSAERLSSEKNVKSFFADADTWSDIKDRYDLIKFILRHAENGTNGEAVDDLKELIQEREISKEAVKIIIERSTIRTEKVRNWLQDI